MFSPDGRFFCSFNSVGGSIGSYLDIYDFDRCTGLLSNHRQQHDVVSWGGIAISPNSRYLYHNFFSKAYQYDLEAPDVLASKTEVATWDGYQSPSPTHFFTMQLAPDGKIYAAAFNRSDILHVIHHPDEPGLACGYEQHGIHLPTYNDQTIPNFPNYRLGPLDGSACDTLGLDNQPIAWWRYAQDTLDPLAVVFHDLSYYEPATWSWDFGDGSAVSSERHPQHQYDTVGVYEVCLTVSNANSSNTHCQTLYLGVSATDNPVLQEQIQVAPNPCRERLYVSLSARLRQPRWVLSNVAGQVVQAQPMALGINEINTADLPPGVYFWLLEAAGERVKAGTVVKVP